MEVLAPVTGTKASITDHVAPSMASNQAGLSEPMPGFLVQKVPISTLLSMAQGNFKGFLCYFRVDFIFVAF